MRSTFFFCNGGIEMFSVVLMRVSVAKCATGCQILFSISIMPVENHPSHIVRVADGAHDEVAVVLL